MPKTLAAKLRHAAEMLAAGTPVPGLGSLLAQAANALDPSASRATLFAGSTVEVLFLEADGGSRGNPGPAGAGAVLRDHSGAVLCQLHKFLGVATNNVAEYKALIMGLQAALKRHPQKLIVKLDSELLVKQLNGLYQVKSEHLKPLYLEARALLGQFARVEITHIARGYNTLADSLANQAMDAGE